MTNAPPESPATAPPPSQARLAALAAELVGTFMLVFSGTATVLAVHRMPKHTDFTATDDIAIALAFALGIVAAVYAVASVSGAHINPAVTVGLAAVGRFPWREVPGYVAAQMAGGILAGVANSFLFRGPVSDKLLLGSTKPGPGVSVYAALGIEFTITFLLMVVVMATAVFEKAPGGASSAGLAIGLWVGAAVFLALPVSGASLNPARTLGPDIVAGQFPAWWVYVAGPVLGACAGAAVWHVVAGHGSKEVVESTAKREVATGRDR